MNGYHPPPAPDDITFQQYRMEIGTHFLLTLETIVFLFHLLGATSKPFSSLSTRLAHAGRLGFFLQKTRYINSLLLLNTRGEKNLGFSIEISVYLGNSTR